MKNLTKIAFIGLLFLCFFTQKATAQTTEYYMGTTLYFDSVIVSISNIQVDSGTKSINPIMRKYVYERNDTLYLELPIGYKRSHRGLIAEIHQYLTTPQPHEWINYIDNPRMIGRRSVLITNTKIPYLVYLYL